MSISYYTVNGQTGTAQTIGNSTYYSSPYGNYSATQIGGQTFYNGDLRGSSYSSGGNTYYNLDGIGNITAQPIGNTTYYNTPLGSFNAQRIGNQTFYSGSINGSSQTIDDTLYFDLPGVASSYPRYIDILTGIGYNYPSLASESSVDSAPAGGATEETQGLQIAERFGRAQTGALENDDIYNIDTFGTRYRIKGGFNRSHPTADSFKFSGDYAGYSPRDMKLVSSGARRGKFKRSLTTDMIGEYKQAFVVVSYLEKDSKYDKALYYNPNGKAKGFGEDGGLIAIIEDYFIFKGNSVFA